MRAPAAPPGTAPGEEANCSPAAESPERPPVRHYDDNVIKWIPLVVPLFAVLLALSVYLAVGSIL